ncbi:nucleotidyltransferase family protein [Pseudoflavonifractor phocaeensis]|uniref:nucleotidyltransferase domain-containing protein n=1 Tax=Pseudoflavonifractor phocaeensis TaxID=1870988 RepID=UPI001956B158|nr:nucleotidyltransferase family protein [Pseudoflavonifractor phocaeensis]MBM6924823.1 nucleotidyltransferase family protein [Pseudoflavonifractor phocaeensis]
MDQFGIMADLLPAGDYLILLLSAALHETDPPDLPPGLTWRQVYHMARRHSVEQLAFYRIKDRVAREDPDTCREWERQCMQYLVLSLTQETEHQAISARFREAGIPLVSLKGAQLAELYPQGSFRQMADLDYLIPPEARQLGANLMEALGYQDSPEEDQADFHAVYHKPPYMTVELHPWLVPPWDPGARYLGGAWDHTVPDGAGGFRLSREFSYLFLVAHMAKHFFMVGCGIRSVLDIYLARTAWEDGMDWGGVESGLRQMGLLSFARQVEALGRDWFGPHPVVPHRSRARIMEQEIYAAGTHGSKLARIAHAVPPDFQRRPMLWNRTVFAWRRLFIGRAYMVRDYPGLEQYPVLLPVCWLRRLFRQLVRRRSPFHET